MLTDAEAKIVDAQINGAQLVEAAESPQQVFQALPQYRGIGDWPCHLYRRRATAYVEPDLVGLRNDRRLYRHRNQRRRLGMTGYDKATSGHVSCGLLPMFFDPAPQIVWYADSLRQQAALDTLLAPIRRVRPGFFNPANGALVIALSIDSQDQSIPLSPSYRVSPLCQKASNTLASVHSRKRWYAELHEQMPAASSAFNLQPVRKTNRTAFMASCSGTYGLWHSRGYTFRGGSRDSICFHSMSLTRQLSSFVTSPIAASRHLCDGSFTIRNVAY